MQLHRGGLPNHIVVLKKHFLAVAAKRCERGQDGGTSPKIYNLYK